MPEIDHDGLLEDHKLMARKRYYLPSVLNVLVDDSRNANGQKGIVPAAHEHDCQAKGNSKQGQGPEM